MDPDESKPPEFPFADPKGSRKFPFRQTVAERLPRRNCPRRKWNAFANASLFLVFLGLARNAYHS
jgi:hypothetical protein